MGEPRLKSQPDKPWSAHMSDEHEGGGPDDIEDQVDDTNDETDQDDDAGDDGDDEGDGDE